MDKSLILYICGSYNLGFAIFHVFFWKIFNWKNDLRKSSIATKAIIQILNICLIYVFLLMAYVYFFIQDELLNTSLGFVLLLGFLGFWITRTIQQYIFLSAKSRMVNILMVIFVIGIIIHLLPIL